MPKLIFHDSDGVDRTVDLGAEPTLIGRAAECQVQTQDALVSRRHARIVWDGGYWIEDLGSSNGVFIGSERVQRARLRPGDEVRCGSLVLRLVPELGRARTGSIQPQQLAPPTPPMAPGSPPPAPSYQPPPSAPPPYAPEAPSNRMASPARGVSAPVDGGGALAEERALRLAAESALAVAEQRASIAEARLHDASERLAAAEAASQRGEQLEQAARQSDGYRRQVEQLRAEVRRLRGGGIEEVTSSQSGPNPVMVAELTAERDQLRARVAELEARAPVAAAPAGGGGEDASLLRRKVDQLTAELRRVRGGQPAAAGADDARVADLEARLLRAEQERDQAAARARALSAQAVAAPAVPAAPPAPAAPRSDGAAIEAVAHIDDALADLRGSLRAASDEVGVLGVEAPGDSVQVLKESLAAATEQLDAARTKVKDVRKLLGGQ